MLTGHAAFTHVPDLDCGSITRQPELMSYDTLSAGQSVSRNRDQEPSPPALCRCRSSMLHKQHRALDAGSLLMIVFIGERLRPQPTDRLTFEVASVKTARSAAGRFTMSGDLGTGEPLIVRGCECFRFGGVLYPANFSRFRAVSRCLVYVRE